MLSSSVLDEEGGGKEGDGAERVSWKRLVLELEQGKFHFILTPFKKMRKYLKTHASNRLIHF
jgi:hypothetical protein